jgi:hypothetical protein
MAYSRWLYSDWYIYHATNGTLATCHCDMKEDVLLHLDYDTVKGILSSKDFTIIEDSIESGEITDMDVLVRCLNEFIEDVDETRAIEEDAKEWT